MHSATKFIERVRDSPTTAAVSSSPFYLIGLGLLSVLAGGYLSFFGNRMLRPFFAAVGGIVGGFVGIVFTDLIAPTSTGEQIMCSIIFGTMSLFLIHVCYKTWRLTLQLLGIIMGFSLAVLLFSILPPPFSCQSWFRRGVLLMGSLLGAVAMHFWEKIILVVGTAIPGSILLTCGLDFYFETSFKERLYAVALGELPCRRIVDPRTYMMFVGTLGVAASGIAVQLLHKEPKKKDETVAMDEEPVIT